MFILSSVLDVLACESVRRDNHITVGCHYTISLKNVLKQV